MAMGGVISRRDDAFCRAVQGVARMPVNALDDLSRRRQERKRTRERSARKEWARSHTKRAQIYMKPAQ